MTLKTNTPTNYTWMMEFVNAVRSTVFLNQIRGTSCLRQGVRVVFAWVRVVLDTGCLEYELSRIQQKTV